MVGVYSIAEVVDDSNKRPERTVFCFLEVDDARDDNIKEKNDMQREKKEKTTNECRRFNQQQLASFNAVGALVESNGGVWVRGGLNELAQLLNSAT